MKNIKNHMKALKKIEDEFSQNLIQNLKHNILLQIIYFVRKFQ
jgi:predicted small metal-binding protein